MHDLIAQIGDTRLRARLAHEWAKATREKQFGLVFEDHLPERLPLPKVWPHKPIGKPSTARHKCICW